MKPASSQGRRLIVLGAVVALHLAVLMAWRGGTPANDKASMPSGPPLIVRFIAEPDRERQAPTADVAAAPKRAAVVGRRSTTTPNATAPAAPAPSGTAVGGLPMPDTAPAGVAASLPPPPLNLDLPQAFRRSASSPARIDVTAGNRPRITPEAAMAARFDQRVIEEQIADGGRRIRQGDRCILVHPSRAGGIDGFDRVHNQVGGAEPCPR